jgi:polysaccharide biosynthesis protein PslL
MGAVMPDRDLSVDVARGIAIVLVVLGHNAAIGSAAPDFIDALFLFHVPLFFLLSGWVQRPQPPVPAAASLARRLLVPFLVAALLVGIAKSLLRGTHLPETLLGIAWGTGQTLPWSHLWFLPALFLALLATQVLRALAPMSVSRAWGWACVAALLAVLALPPATGPDFARFGFAAPAGWPWSLDLLPSCLLFVWLGVAMAERPPLRAALTRPAVVGLAVLVFALALPARLDLNLRELSPRPLALLGAAAGSLATLAAARGLVRLPAVAAPLALVGRHTMAIFLLHVSIQKALLVRSGVETESRAAFLLLGVATAAAAIAIGLAVSLLWDRVLARRREPHARVSKAAT